MSLVWGTGDVNVVVFVAVFVVVVFFGGGAVLFRSSALGFAMHSLDQCPCL